MDGKDWAQQLPVIRSKADLVYDRLRAAISGGDLRPGARVNMDELARELGVSKIPIREAVKRLEAEGLVVSRVHSGVTVAELDHREMRGVFLAREAIEALVVRLAAERGGEELASRLGDVQAEMREHLAAGRIERMAEANSRFHGLLAAATGYQVLGDLTEQLLMTVRRYRVVAPLDGAKWRTVLDEHDAILTALRAGDAQAAEAAARTHIRSRADSEG